MLFSATRYIAQKATAWLALVCLSACPALRKSGLAVLLVQATRVGDAHGGAAWSIFCHVHKVFIFLIWVWHEGCTCTLYLQACPSFEEVLPWGREVYNHK